MWTKVYFRVFYIVYSETKPEKEPESFHPLWKVRLLESCDQHKQREHTPKQHTISAPRTERKPSVEILPIMKLSTLS